MYTQFRYREGKMDKSMTDKFLVGETVLSSMHDMRYVKKKKKVRLEPNNRKVNHLILMVKC